MLAPAEVELDDSGDLPLLVVHEDLPPLTDDIVRDVLDVTRR